MTTKSLCPDGDCPTVGVDATPLERFRDVDTGDGEWLIYDRDCEGAWIQSDLYVTREASV
ncbi:hypothetical protein [Natronomonas marina]|jgi:hypothetical protein|uniref:hypothetical protein n=1 Tax=Natronomonas marina TaxID=2961939 RepID=UPI0020C9E17C|nr:hypothetical protein [Natronomonas marina]